MSESRPESGPGAISRFRAVVHEPNGLGDWKAGVAESLPVAGSTGVS